MSTLNREPTYIERIAQAIWWESGETDAWYPTDEASLWLGYAVLCITKREKVTAFDMHQAWSAWATVKHEGTHRSLISFEWLDKDVQDYDILYRDAIRRVSKIVGRYDAYAHDEISVKGWNALAEKRRTPSEVKP